MEIPRRRRAGWTSWAGTVRAEPAELAAPRSVAELASLITRVAERGGTVRPVGSGRSWTPLPATDDVMASVDQLGGTVRISADGRQVRCPAGTTVRTLVSRLAEARLALPVVGEDLDVTVGGALATGTHGSGGTLGAMHAAVEALELVDGTGHLQRLEGEDLLAARLSLGALGVLTEVTLSVLPSHRLATRTSRVALADAVADFGHHVADHHHAEFAWLPHTSSVELTLADTTDDPAGPAGPAGSADGLADRASDLVRRQVPGWALRQLARTFPEAAAEVSGAMAGLIGDRNRVASGEVATRGGRYQALEMAIPAPALGPVIGALQVMVTTRDLPVAAPVVVRAVPADHGAWLSPTWGRDSVCVQVRAVRGMPYTEWFRAAQDLLWAHDGRPHWGMVHTKGAADLAPRYPAWDAFQAVRRRLDPHGVLTSPYLRRVLGALA